MSGKHTIQVGDKGRIVIPADIRESAGLTEGTALVLIDSPGGLVLMTREQLLSRVRSEVEGLDLVSDLLADRRRASSVEDDVR